jgi:hypothetical protein
LGNRSKIRITQMVESDYRPVTVFPDGAIIRPDDPTPSAKIPKHKIPTLHKAGILLITYLNTVFNY